MRYNIEDLNNWEFQIAEDEEGDFSTFSEAKKELLKKYSEHLEEVRRTIRIARKLKKGDV